MLSLVVRLNRESRSGLAVACMTAVREVLGSSRTVGSCVYRKNPGKNHSDLQPCLGQLLPSVGR